MPSARRRPGDVESVDVGQHDVEHDQIEVPSCTAASADRGRTSPVATVNPSYRNAVDTASTIECSSSTTSTRCSPISASCTPSSCRAQHCAQRRRVEFQCHAQGTLSSLTRTSSEGRIHGVAAPRTTATCLVGGFRSDGGSRRGVLSRRDVDTLGDESGPRTMWGGRDLRPPRQRCPVNVVPRPRGSGSGQET